MKTLLNEADGLQFWQEVSQDLTVPISRRTSYLVLDTHGSRTARFITKKEGYRYFRKESAAYRVYDNTLWDSAKVDSIMGRK